MSVETSNNELETKNTNGLPAEGGVDAEGYEYHYASTSSTVIQGSNARNNVLEGSGSDDTLTGGNLNDVVDGGNGSDNLNGGNGNDIVIGGGNTDHGTNDLNGGSGDDILVAGGTQTQALNTLLNQNPTITTSVLNDPKWGSAQSIINGPIDNSGGGVHDVFIIHSGSGNDSIYNFHPAVDVVQFDSNINGSGIKDINTLLQHTTMTGTDVHIDLGAGNSVTLVGVDVSALTANNAVFV